MLDAERTISDEFPAHRDTAGKFWFEGHNGIYDPLEYD